ncbi:Uncharacterised protein [uncultured archaeon]|nr:Uncharacterised protein [uncultured archaeon]
MMVVFQFVFLIFFISSSMTLADIFPAEPFNGLQVSYSVSGAGLSAPKDSEGFTCYRKLEGKLTGDELTVSGTASAGNGWGATIDVSVSVDGQEPKSFHQEKFPKNGLAGDVMNQQFSVTLPVPSDAKEASFTISLEGSYNAGSRGVVVEASLNRSYSMPVEETSNNAIETGAEGRSECVGCSKGLCAEAALRFLIPIDEVVNYGSIQVNYEDLKADFEDAIDRYNDENAIKAFSSDNAVGALPALSWLQSQGGTIDRISEKFVFTTEKDRNTRTITPESVKGHGIERSLYYGIMDCYDNNNGKKLTPGDVLFLALKERKGDVREALLLSHNLMRSLARENDQTFTDVPRDLTFFNKYLEPMVTREPLGEGQNAGMWYHLFGTAYYEMQGRGEWGPIGLGEAMIGNVHNAIDEVVETLLYDPELKEPPNRAVVSILANEIEQGYRLFKTNSPNDPEKYCINVYGAQLGAWLYGDKLKKQRGPTQSLPESYEKPSDNPIPSRRILVQLCPVNVIWEGKGASMEMDQKTESISGFYPVSILPFFENESGSWGLIWTEQRNDPYKVSFEAVEDGWHHLMIIDNETGSAAVYSAYMNAGDKSSIDIDPDGSEMLLIQDDGQVIRPVVVDLQERNGAAGEPSATDKSHSEVLYDSWNIYSVKNAPTCGPFFSIDRPYMMTYIDTYHWNWGKGTTSAGTIALKNGDGEIFGPWTVTLESGSGVANVWWISHPNEIIPAGNYTVVDSDPDTWSWNSQSSCGFAKVEGYAYDSEAGGPGTSLSESQSPYTGEVEGYASSPSNETISTPYAPLASSGLGELLYSDDFSDMNSGWARKSSDPDMSSMGYENGRYHIIRKKPGLSWSYPPDCPIFKDFSVESETKQEEGPDNNQYGLVLRRDTSGNYYCFQVSGTGNYRFDINQKGQWREIVPYAWSSKINVGNAKNILRVECKGDRFTFYANGAKIGEAQDSTIPAGRIGLAAGALDDQTVHISFDNLKIWALGV